MSKTRMPSAKNVAAALERYKGRCDGECVDIRLQVYPADGFPFVGEWAIRFGDSSYDLDHNGYWGASCIESTRALANCETSRTLRAPGSSAAGAAR
jgi:hypothetical protein